MEKLDAINKEFKNFGFEKIADVGTEFIYRIGLGKTTSEDKTREFLFNAIIEEDLYLKSKNGEDWTLCPCICKTTECLEGDVQMIESIPGTSLSNLFGNVVTFYFPFQRSTACNAFDTFFFKDKFERPRLNHIKYRHVNSINEFRKRIIRKHSDLVSTGK